MPSSVSFDGASTKGSTLTSRAPIPREKFQTFCFELEKEIYSIFELTGLPGCSNWETHSSDSLKARRSRYKVRTCVDVWRLRAPESPLCHWPLNCCCLIDSFWCASGDSQKEAYLMVLLSEPAYAISAIGTQGAVIERSWVSSYLFYGRFVNDPYYPATDDKGHIKVAFLTNVLCSYLKLVSQFKEKRALRPVVNVVCSVHKKMKELCSHYRHSFSCRFFFFQEFKGNSDQSSIVRHWLKHQLYAT